VPFQQWIPLTVNQQASWDESAQYGHLQGASMSETYDAIIVGGGIMGCSTVFELSRRGYRVALLEKGSLGGVSTERSSAIIRLHYSNELTARMALHSLGTFQHFEEEVGGTCGFTQTGFLALVSDADLAGLRRNIALQQRLGIATSEVTPEEVGRLLPHAITDDIAAAAFEPESGYADPHLTTSAYAEAARRLGTTLFPDTTVMAIRFDGNRITGVDTDRRRFDAPVVVNCAGPWGARVAALAGVEVPVNACRVQVAIFRPPPERRGQHPVVLDFLHATYFRSETGGLTLVGLIDPAEGEAVVDPDDFQESVDADFAIRVGEPWLRRCPSLDGSESLGGFTGLYAVTPDWHPVIDEVPSGSGHYLCVGFSGHGFKLAPAVSVMVADLISRDPSPQFPVSAFRLTRFAEQDLMRGEYEYSITG
jgi:glycine/D-amino acid oxidase-like deaminating enzyme